jgi:hypothetical protein
MRETIMELMFVYSTLGQSEQDYVSLGASRIGSTIVQPSELFADPGLGYI